MKQLACLCLLLLGTGIAQAGPDIQHWNTKNGMRVYFVEAHEIPMINLRLTFAAGASRDSGAGGLASMTSSMLSQGAGELDADELAKSFERLGAGMGSGSLRDMAWLSLRSLSDPEYITPALELFSKVLWEPTFPEKDFTRLKKQYLTGLKAQEASPGTIASKKFYAALYGDHPYGQPPSGTLESVPEITLAQIRAFHEKYYVAANGLIAIMGDLDRATAEKLAELLSAELPTGEPAAKLPLVKPLEKGETIKIDFPSKQAHVIVGAPAIERGHPDFFPLYLGNHVFGGSGMTSDLSQLVREEKGYAYSIGSSFQLMEAPGPYVISLQTRGNQSEDAVKLVQEALEGFLQDGPADEKLASSVKNITGSFPLKIATNSNILQYLTFIGFYNMSLEYLETFNANIEAVNKAQIIEAFKKHVDPNKLITVVVGGEA